MQSYLIYAIITMGQDTIYSNEKRQQQKRHGAYKTDNEGKRQIKIC
jgi:hypothetical protein